MIEHNVVSVDGLEYKAVKTKQEFSCFQCSIVKDSDCELLFCFSENRADMQDVIYKRHYRPKHNELPIKVIEL